MTKTDADRKARFEQGKKRVEALVAKARKNVARMDAADRKAGFASPAMAGPAEVVHTARAALECAMQLEDWDTVAEAYVLLEKIPRARRG